MEDTACFDVTNIRFSDLFIFLSLAKIIGGVATRRS